MEKKSEAGVEALSIMTRMGTTGVCHLCLKPEHTANYCRTTRVCKELRPNISGNCFECGKKGHRAEVAEGTLQANKTPYYILYAERVNKRPTSTTGVRHRRGERVMSGRRR